MIKGFKGQVKSAAARRGGGLLLKNFMGPTEVEGARGRDAEGSEGGRPPRGIRSRGDNFHVRRRATIVLRGNRCSIVL